MSFALCTLVVIASLTGCDVRDNGVQESAASGSRSVTATPASDADTAVVAVTSRGPITYRKIRCGTAVPKERCREVEQENLRVRLSQLIVFAAAETHNVKLTPAELQAVDSQVAEQREGIDRAARSFRAAISGAARVYAGQQVNAVAAELGIPAAMIDGAMSEYRTEAEVQVALRRDIAKELEDAARQTYIRSKLTEKLRTLVNSQAVQAKMTDSEAADAFFKDVARRHQFRVTDSRYELPDFKGVLNDYEISIQSSPQH